MPMRLFPILPLLALPFAAQGQILNGNLEAFTLGRPDNWTYTQNSGSVLVQETTIRSPFTNRYALSTSSVRLTDASGIGPSLRSTFGPVSGLVTFSFDFRLASGSGGIWDAELGGGNGTFNIFRINAGTLTFADSSPTGINVVLTRDAWYQYSLSLDTDSTTYSISLTPFGGSTTTWTDREAFNPTSLSNLLVRDFFTSGASPTFYLDNVYLSAVPEPSTGAECLGAGILFWLASLRFKTARQTRVSRHAREA
jgi:hypothetical protein